MRKIYLLLLSLLSFGSWASELGPDGFKTFMSKATNGAYTVGFSSGGTPLVSTPPPDLTPGGGWVRAGSAMVSTHPSGFEARTRVNLPISPKASVPLNVSAVIPKLNVIASLQRCMGNVVCALGVTAGSAALGEWLSSAGLSTNPSAQNPDELFRYSEPGACSSDCYYWQASNGVSSNHFVTALSPTSACQATANSLNYPGWTFGSITKISDTVYSCYINGYGNVGIARKGSRPPDVSLPVTFDSAMDKLHHVYAPPSVVPGITPFAVIQTNSPTISGPSRVTGEKSVTTEKISNPASPTGFSQKETTKTTSYELEYTGDTVKTRPVTETTVKIDGVEVPELSKTEDGKPAEDTLTCGLPHTPPCKINEEGTPEAQQDTHKKDVDDALVDLKRLSANPATFWPTFPQIRWDFALPTGCAAIAIPAFAPWLQEIDICQFQPIFHDIMSVVWVLGGLFGAISTFWRSTFAKAA